MDKDCVSVASHPQTLQIVIDKHETHTHAQLSNPFYYLLSTVTVAACLSLASSGSWFSL